MNPSEQITTYIAGVPGWRGQTLARLRKLILEANPGLTEEWKWNTPVWSHKGLVCAITAFKEHVGINFFQGASLADPHGLFNSGLDAKAMRSIKLREGDTLNESDFQELVRAAVAHDAASSKKPAAKRA